MNLLNWLKSDEIKAFAPLPEPPQPSCQHQWIERARSYAPPIKIDEVPIQLSDDEASSILVGSTILIDECQVCHQIRQTKFAGSTNTELQEILSKVSLYGTQYLQKDGETFIFQRYQPPMAAGVPLR